MSFIQVVTAAEQQRLDAESVAFGTPAATLMDSAGTNAAQWMLRRKAFESAVVFCGPAGNGGDGFVVARVLIEHGIRVRTICRTNVSDLGEPAKTMASHVLAAGGRIEGLGRDCVLDELAPALPAYDWIVDGWFGSGLSRPLSGRDAALVELVNGCSTPVISLDLPSGLASGQGEMIGPAVRADHTLAMQYYKPAHLFEPAAAWCGRLHQIPVSYPDAVLKTAEWIARVPTPAAISERLPQRSRSAHKGTFGRLLVVAGSWQMKGAAVLCCRAALRAGTGLVTLMHPESIAPAIAAAVPEALTLPMPDCEGAFCDGEIPHELGDVIAAQDVMAIGPGMTRTSDALALVRRMLAGFPGPLVIDADALAALDSPTLRAIRGRAVLTPHHGEMARLAGLPMDEVTSDPLGVARSYARTNGVCVLLKGRPSVVATADGDCAINPTGNQGLATGGSGDVLTGLIGGLLAGGVDLEDAALVGSYVHGAAADTWVARFAERGLTPTDLIDLLPSTIKEYES